MFKINTMSSVRLLILHTHLSISAIVISLIYLSNYERLLKIGNMFNCYFVWILPGIELTRFLLNKYLFQFEILQLTTTKSTAKAKSSKIFKSIKTSIQTGALLLTFTLIFTIVCIIFGAPVLRNYEQTLTLSIMLTSLTIFPYGLYLKPAGTLQYLLMENFELSTKNEQAFLKFIRNNAIGTIIGAWCGSVVAPLDWNCQWQMYPIPNMCGILIGYGLANLYSFALGLYEMGMAKKNVKAKKP